MANVKVTTTGAEGCSFKGGHHAFGQWQNGVGARQKVGTAFGRKELES